MMSNRNKPTAAPPPTLGEGCLARYDPDALDEQDGTEFEGAADLWQQLNPPGDASAPAADVLPDTGTPDRPPADRSSR